jgi:hypothetical protein
MRLLVYFDTNVFDHLYKKAAGITEQDLQALRSTVYSGKVSILPSTLDVEEILSALNSCPDLALAELQLMHELADWDKLVKPPATNHRQLTF